MSSASHLDRASSDAGPASASANANADSASFSPAELSPATRARNLFGWLFMLLTCVFLGPPIVLVQALLLPFGNAHRWGDFNVLWWVSTLRWLWRVEVTGDGLQHISPGSTYVIACNHRSHLDPVATIVALRRHLRFGFIVKRSLTLIPIWGWFIWMNGYVPVDRGRTNRRNDPVRAGVRYLKRGRSVLIYPEGTRAPDHRFLPFKKGAFLLALKAGVPILPVVVSGTGDLLPKSRLFVRPGRVRVEVLPPIPTTGMSVEARDALLEQVRDGIVGRYRMGASEPPLEEQAPLRAALAPRR
ncbi:MAG: lysophospholipid acyltransferase family protein [Myxococcota bacterium]